MHDEWDLTSIRPTRNLAVVRNRNMHFAYQSSWALLPPIPAMSLDQMVVLPYTEGKLSSDEGSGKYNFSNLLDGKSGTWVQTGSQQDPYLMVDLGEEHNVMMVHIENREDCCQDRLLPYEIYVGNDEGNPTKNRMVATGEVRA